MFQIMQSVLEGMLEHARKTAPEECCGLLAGRTALITELLPCTNERRSPTSFSIPALELLAAFREWRGQGKRLRGIYHSHPTGPEGPSRRDADELEYPEASYWIISLHHSTPVVRCYYWAGTEFAEADFRVVPAERRSGEPSSMNTRGEWT